MFGFKVESRREINDIIGVNFYYMAESTPKPCEFYITPHDDMRFMKTSIPIIHVFNGNRCPRNLSTVEQAQAVPDGITPCPLYDQQRCARAFTEELYCPKRRGDREAQLIQQLYTNDPSFEDIDGE